MFKLIVAIVLTLFFGSYLSQENSACGNWTSFKDEKCYKFFNHLTSWSKATNYCLKQDNQSTLVFIKIKEEQDAIVKLLMASDVADNVWIGITKENGIFKNADQTVLSFKNWAENRPVANKTGLDCVDLSTDESNYGKWFDEKCQKQNAVVCEKIQPWSTSRLQTILLDTRRELKAQILHLQQNPVPIGFIYAQVLGQSDPKTLWPNTEWENISPKLAGLFFRVEGGEAANFSEIREQQTQSIVVSDWGTEGNRLPVDPVVGGDTPLTIGPKFSAIFSGAKAANNWHYHLFRHNIEEIRPRNSAIKLWKRIK